MLSVFYTLSFFPLQSFIILLSNYLIVQEANGSNLSFNLARSKMPKNGKLLAYKLIMSMKIHMYAYKLA